jgi:hypothetical protein
MADRNFDSYNDDFFADDEVLYFARGFDDDYCDEGDCPEFYEDMDGDFDSAMESAGHGTDEDYGYYGDEGDY